MSFTMHRMDTPIQNIKSYKQIAGEFCAKYYLTFDENINELSKFYYDNSQFTFLDKEFVGYYELFRTLEKTNIRTILHNSLNITCQPIGRNNLLIVITGDIYINNCFHSNKFMETLFIEILPNNEIKICSTIFKLVT